MKNLTLAVAGYQLGLYHTSLHAPLQTLRFTSACPFSTVELEAPGATIAFVTNVTAVSAPTPSRTHEVVVLSDDSSESVIEALNGLEDTDGSVYECSSDGEDASEAASDISMRFLDDEFGSMLGAVHQDTELSDDNAGSLSDYSVMSLDEETCLVSDLDAHSITPDTSQEAQLSVSDSAFPYRRLRTSSAQNLYSIFALISSLNA